jgi:hypothetical protein
MIMVHTQKKEGEFNHATISYESGVGKEMWCPTLGAFDRRVVFTSEDDEGWILGGWGNAVSYVR